MTKLATLSVLGLLCATCAAQAQAVIKLSPDKNTVTATNDRGTATTTIQRHGDGTATLTTRYQPNNSYKPMGGTYQPMGSTYKPTGR